MSTVRMKILVVEDEVIIAADLMQMLTANGYDVAGPAVDYDSAKVFLAHTQPDLVLLDINLLGEKDGIELAAHIQKTHHLPFIFTSALHDPLTIERARVTQPATYLVKPFREDQLLAAIAIALNNFSGRQGFNVEEEDHLLLKDAIFIRVKKSFLKIQVKDILWLKAADNYVEVYTADKKYLVRSTLSNFVRKLNQPGFIKTHKSYIINIAHLSSIHPMEVNIQHNRIPLAKNYLAGLMEKVQKI